MTEKKQTGKAIGGLARAEALEPVRRSEIARRAAAVRWGLKATHKGNFKKEFGVDVECYVLNNVTKAAVISQRGMARALGFGSGGQAFPRFLNSKAMVDALGSNLKEKLENPVKFLWSPSGPSGPPPITLNGFEAGLLIDICNAVIAAEAKGNFREGRHKTLIQQSHIIVGASAKAGIQGLIYALAGYDRTKEEVIASYKMYVAAEAREYEREFSPELYEQWYRLYGLVKPERGRPWEFRYLTIDHIYKPLAKSNGKVFSLAKSSKMTNGEKGDKIHQFLSSIGVKALRTQVGKITGIAIVSETREEYEKHIEEKIHGQRRLPFENS